MTHNAAPADEPVVNAAAVRDPDRLAAVHRTGLLDTPAEEAFDRLTRLAAKVTRAPVTFISLVDAERDFYKSSFGFGEPLATERQLSGVTFCHYTVGSYNPVVIPDVRADPEFSRVPTVESLGVAAYLGVPLIDADGHPIGSFCAIDFEPHAWSDTDVEVVRELAESTMREIGLRQAVTVAEDEGRRAAAAVRARDEVMAIVSHDLRNPLSTIQAAASLLREERLSADETSRLLGTVHRSATTMNRLIQDLLDVSRIEGGHLNVRRDRVDLGAVIANACELLQDAARVQGITLSGHAQPVYAEGDADRIAQVLDNLIGNAIKFTPAGGNVRVTARLDASRVEVAVSDTGQGIEPEAQAHIFDRFWQASRTDRAGAGLGLAIVKGVVEAHGGTVAVESVPDGGTTVRFTLPAASHPAGSAP